MPTAYLVPHTHYDVAWAFSKDEYLRINEAILDQALKLMKAPDFKFCIEQAFLLKSIEQRNPALFKRIANMIKAGRLQVVDGQYLMADTMLPTGEVLLREILFGKRYLKEKFGIDVPVAWAADSFGMNAQLPQIYKKAGYQWLAFRRGARTDIKESEFLWEGLDGTMIIAHWFPLGYRAGLNIDQWPDSIAELKKYACTPHILMPCGSGSMPPQPEIVAEVKKWNKNNPDVKMKIATPDEFFRALESCDKKPETIEGELYDDELVAVFPQVCSSRTWIVQNTRECEELLITAEEFATVAWLLGAEYPTADFKEIWEKALFIAFHDIITGCGVDEIYNEVREIFAFLKGHLHRILRESLSYIAAKIDSPEKGTAVFNPLPHPTKNWVESGKSGFVAEAPPLGYKVYTTPPRNKADLKIKKNEVTTPFFRLKADDNTGIIEVTDKKGRKLLSGNELVIEDEVGDLYYHRSRFTPELIKSESGEGIKYGNFKPISFQIEKEESRARILSKSEYYCLTWPYRLKDRFPPMLYNYKTLDITKEVIVYADLPRIEFVTKIDNKYPNIRLRVKFDTGIERKLCFRETQFGVIPEPTEYFVRGKGGEPSGIPNFLSWFDISDGARGVTFMNRGLPAAEQVGTATYITLFRSVYGLSADGVAGPLVPTPDALELGSYTFEYAVQPHEGDWRQAEIYRQAPEFNRRPTAIQANPGGKLPAEHSFLKLSPGHLILSALKKAEDSDAVILRFFETTGEVTQAEIELFKDIKRLTVVDLLEREEAELPGRGKLISLEVKPFEIVTLKLEF
ncbi:MAG: glycosyl hydrolase-related protein [Dehalococcoidia bacterium]|jgi:alpha-mannosidase